MQVYIALACAIAALVATWSWWRATRNLGAAASGTACVLMCVSVAVLLMPGIGWLTPTAALAVCAVLIIDVVALLVISAKLHRNPDFLRELRQRLVTHQAVGPGDGGRPNDG